MFLLFGFRSLRSVIARVSLACHYCDVHAEQRVVKRSMRLTVFFVPVLPLWTSYLMQCSNCAAETKLTADQAERSVEWARARERS